MKENSSPSLHLGRETEKSLHQERGSQGRSPADCAGAAPDWVHVAPKASGASTEPSGTPHFPKKPCSQIRAALIRTCVCAQCCLLWQRLPFSSLINWGWWALSSPEIRDCVISGPFPPQLPRLGLPRQFFHQCGEQISPTSWPSIKFQISVLLRAPLSAKVSSLLIRHKQRFPCGLHTDERPLSQLSCCL